MLHRLIGATLESGRYQGFLTTFLRLSAFSLTIGLLAACISFYHRGYEHISTLFPDLLSLDSVYIKSRGFPCAQWASNDPQLSGFGDPRSAFLPYGFLANTALFSILTFPVTIALWLLFRLVCFIRFPAHQ